MTTLTYTLRPNQVAAFNAALKDVKGIEIEVIGNKHTVQGNLFAIRRALKAIKAA